MWRVHSQRCVGVITSYSIAALQKYQLSSTFLPISPRGYESLQQTRPGTCGTRGTCPTGTGGWLVNLASVHPDWAGAEVSVRQAVNKVKCSLNKLIEIVPVQSGCKRDPRCSARLSDAPTAAANERWMDEEIESLNGRMTARQRERMLVQNRKTSESLAVCQSLCEPGRGETSRDNSHLMCRHCCSESAGGYQQERSEYTESTLICWRLSRTSWLAEWRTFYCVSQLTSVFDLISILLYMVQLIWRV